MQCPVKIAVCILILLPAPLLCQAAQAPAVPQNEAPPHTHITAQWLDCFHKPADWLAMGMDIRLRWEYYSNATTLNNETAGDIASYFRYRGRIWGTAALSPESDLNARLVYEPRTYERPDSLSGPTQVNEALFDKLNLTLRNFADLPCTAVIGRQDITLGKGWLVTEGTAKDGSRTAFFDAARFTLSADTANTLELIYVHQKADSESWLHPFNSRNLAVTHQDEEGAILYLTNTSLKDTVLEGYAIYKNDDPVDHSFANLTVSQSRKAEIATFGAAMSQKLNDNWDYRLEGAVQLGHKQATNPGKMQDLRAWGTNNVLTYSFNDPCANTSHIGWEYLSGDSRSSDTLEQWDPLWGESARWTELFQYPYSSESACTEWTNLNRFNVGHSLKVSPELTLTGDYNLILAPEHPLAGTGKFGNGRLRGHLLSAWLRYQCCKQLSGHIVAEYLFPGNYYAPDYRDEAIFFRINMEYVF